MAALSLTYNLTNGTNEDASQVMQNFTDIEDYVNTDVVKTDGSNNMAAALNLFGDPTADAHAVRKAYMDGAYLYVTSGINQVWTSGVQNTVKFSSEVTDSASAYNVSTGKFTAPKTGVYLVSWTAKPDQSLDFLVRMFIVADGVTYNGPRFVPKGVNTINEAAMLTFCLPVRCTAGQTIDPQASTAPTTATFAMGEQLTITWLHG